MLAFLPSLGFQEMVLLVVVGLLLYGRNLPEAGRSLGRMAAQVRRGWQEFKDQLDREGDLRQVTHTVRDAAQELKRAAAVPLAGANPARALQGLRDEVLAEPSAHGEASGAEVGEAEGAAALEPATEAEAAAEAARANAAAPAPTPEVRSPSAPAATQPRHGRS